MANYKATEGIKICGIHNERYDKYYDECLKCREARNFSTPYPVDIYVKTPFPHIKIKKHIQITGE